MRLLRTELESTNSPEAPAKPTRWFITSRNVKRLRESLTGQGTILVDLEDEKYFNQVRKELYTHVKNSIAQLGKAKAYNKATEYFATSVISERAQNTHWIDIIVAQLQQMSNNNLEVRVLLEDTPESLPDLLTQFWKRILKLNADHHARPLEELLRCLILTYEDPSEEELAALAGFNYSNAEELQRLRQYIKSCQPLLDIQPRANGEQRVQFIKPDVKLHLLKNAQTLLGLSDDGIKLQHGLLALNSFSHIRERFGFELTDSDIVQRLQELKDSAQLLPDQVVSEDDNDGQQDGSSTDTSSDAASYVSDSLDGWWNVREEDPEADLLRDRALAYPVKYWLQHCSEATVKISDGLSQDASFWTSESIIRRRWLLEYDRLTDLFLGFGLSTLTGLHIAAAAGFGNLTSALIRNGYKDEIDKHDDFANTPLHFAAYFGRLDNIEVLLNHNANIDDGKEENMQTPLCMAALEGRVDVMRLLLNHQADKNAMSEDGPVICAAVYSGNCAAVELLVENGVSLTHGKDNIPSPLELAARMPDMSMFNLISKYDLPDEEYSKAMVSAVDEGRLELFEHLLTLTHSPKYYQPALDAAAKEWNWEIVLKLLKTKHVLKCDTVVFEAATASVSQGETQEHILRKVATRPNTQLSPKIMADALYTSTDKEKTNSVKLLLELFQADPDAIGEEYGNAVSASAYDGTGHILRMLLEAKASLNGPNDYSLQLAAAQGHGDIVTTLLNHGADINRVTDREPGTAIQAACDAGDLDMVQLLLKNHADPNLGTGKMSPPLIAAACQGQKEILEELVTAKANVNVFGGWDNSSVLIYAVTFLSLESHELLLKHGADINLPDEKHDTPLIAAAVRGDVESENSNNVTGGATSVDQSYSTPQQASTQIIQELSASQSYSTYSPPNVQNESEGRYDATSGVMPGFSPPVEEGAYSMGVAENNNNNAGAVTFTETGYSTLQQASEMESEGRYGTTFGAMSSFNPSVVDYSMGGAGSEDNAGVGVTLVDPGYLTPSPAPVLSVQESSASQSYSTYPPPNVQNEYEGRYDTTFEAMSSFNPSVVDYSMGGAGSEDNAAVGVTLVDPGYHTPSPAPVQSPVSVQSMPAPRPSLPPRPGNFGAKRKPASFTSYCTAASDALHASYHQVHTSYHQVQNVVENLMNQSPQPGQSSQAPQNQQYNWSYNNNNNPDGYSNQSDWQAQASNQAGEQQQQMASGSTTDGGGASWTSLSQLNKKKSANFGESDD